MEPSDDDDGTPTALCPRCNRQQPDYDGLGVLRCTACGFCEHPAGTAIDKEMTAFRCDVCGEIIT